ncbi:ASH1-related protein 2 [Actinidia rufa]|uniref:ASH1-related protein 2 n=1 Tax=Actinidia rufa TaxID=165716 RepID=A0A7J0HE22_9ERIC|nr:ASH1-related protein 2 [Actinidia rufa]
MRNIVNRPHNDVGIETPSVGSIHVIESTSIRKAIVIEKRSVRVNTVSPNRSLTVFGKRLHQAKGVELVLGQQRRRELWGEAEFGGRRREGRHEGVEETGGGSGGVGGLFCALKREKSAEIGRGNGGQVVGGDEEACLDLAVVGERRRRSEEAEGLADPGGVGGGEGGGAAGGAAEVGEGAGGAGDDGGG